MLQLDGMLGGLLSTAAKAVGFGDEERDQILGAISYVVERTDKACDAVVDIAAQVRALHAKLDAISARLPIDAEARLREG